MSVEDDKTVQYNIGEKRGELLILQKSERKRRSLSDESQSPVLLYRLSERNGGIRHNSHRIHSTPTPLEREKNPLHWRPIRISGGHSLRRIGAARTQ